MKGSGTTIQVQPVRKLNLSDKSSLSAASGAVVHEDSIYVICDDENKLGIFPLESRAPGKTLTLARGRLPEEKVARKKVKADWESLVLIPARSPANGGSCLDLSTGGLLTVPSGSKPNRVIGKWIPFLADGKISRKVTTIDFTELYRRLGKKLKGLNIEGGVVSKAHLLLFHRGNAKGAKNAVIRISLKSFLKNLTDSRVADGKVKDIRTFQIGKIEGVKLTVTDGALNAEGKLWILAAAEDTESAVEDGAYKGAVIGRLDLDTGKLKRLRLLACPEKPEGLFFSGTEPGRFFLVTDADDRKIPARLYVGNL